LNVYLNVAEMMDVIEKGHQAFKSEKHITTTTLQMHSYLAPIKLNYIVLLGNNANNQK